MVVLLLMTIIFFIGAKKYDSVGFYNINNINLADDQIKRQTGQSADDYDSR